LATMNSVGSMPFTSALSISSGLILRDALAISVVLLIREAIPVPEPPPVTDILDDGLICWYCSAHARARLTIVSDPTLFRYSLESGWGASSLPGCVEQAAKIIKIRIKAK